MRVNQRVIIVEPHELPDLKTNNQSTLENIWPKEDAYYTDVKPILFVLRVFGRFPLNIRNTINTDLYSIEIRLQWIVYTIIVTMIILWLTSKNLIMAITIEESKIDSDTILRSTIAFTQIIVVIQAPLFLKGDGKQFVRYLNKWRNFQVHYETYMGKASPRGLRRYIVATICIIILFSIAVLNCIPLYIIPIPWLQMIPHYIVVITSYLHMTIWFLTSRRLIRVTKNLKNRIFMTMTYQWDRERWMKISQYRILWMKLSELTQKLGSEVMVGNLGVTLFALLTMATTSMYLMILDALNSQFTLSTILYLIIFVSAYIQLFCICNLGHMTTYKLEKFIRFMILNRPTIKLLGYIAINRPLMIWISNIIIKYVIISLQFNSKE